MTPARSLLADFRKIGWNVFVSQCLTDPATWPLLAKRCSDFQTERTKRLAKRSFLFGQCTFRTTLRWRTLAGSSILLPVAHYRFAAPFIGRLVASVHSTLRSLGLENRATMNRATITERLLPSDYYRATMNRATCGLVLGRFASVRRPAR